MKYKFLNGLCVPVSTPDDYFKQSANRWLNHHRLLIQVSRNQQQQNQEREEARTEYQKES